MEWGEDCVKKNGMRYTNTLTATRPLKGIFLNRIVSICGTTLVKNHECHNWVFSLLYFLNPRKKESGKKKENEIFLGGV